jgi:hypothetical protein
MKRRAVNQPGAGHPKDAIGGGAPVERAVNPLRTFTSGVLPLAKLQAQTAERFEPGSATQLPRLPPS